MLYTEGVITILNESIIHPSKIVPFTLKGINGYQLVENFLSDGLKIRY